MHETYLQNEREFDKKFKCIQGDCDGNGCIPYQVGDGEWEADQCQFHAEYLFPIKSHNRTSLIKVMKALVDELEREKHKNISEMETGSEFMTPRMYRAIAHNQTLQLAIDKINNFINKIQINN